MTSPNRQEVSDDAGWILVSISIAIMFLIYLPLISYYAYKFWCLRNTVALYKRYSDITILSIIPGTLLLFLTSADFILINLRKTQDVTQYRMVVEFFVVVSTYGYSCLILWRFWMSYFDIMWYVQLFVFSPFFVGLCLPR